MFRIGVHVSHFRCANCVPCEILKKICHNAKIHILSGGLFRGKEGWKVIFAAIFGWNVATSDKSLRRALSWLVTETTLKESNSFKWSQHQHTNYGRHTSLYESTSKKAEKNHSQPHFSRLWHLKISILEAHHTDEVIKNIILSINEFTQPWIP